MDENIKMFLRMIAESMDDPAVENLEAEAKQLEERIEKNQQEIENLQKQIADLSPSADNETACGKSEDGKQA